MKLPRTTTRDSALNAVNDCLSTEHKVPQEEIDALAQVTGATSVGELMAAGEMDPLGRSPWLRLWEWPRTGSRICSCTPKAAALFSALKAHFAREVRPTTPASKDLRTHELVFPEFEPILKEEMVTPLSPELFQEWVAIDNLPDAIHDAAKAAAVAAGDAPTGRRPGVVRLFDLAQAAADAPPRTRKAILEFGPALKRALGPPRGRKLAAKLTVRPSGREHSRRVRLANGRVVLTVRSTIEYEGLHAGKVNELWAKRTVEKSIEMPSGFSMEVIPADGSRPPQSYAGLGEESAWTDPCVLPDGAYDVRITAGDELVSEERLILEGTGTQFIDFTKYLGYEFSVRGKDKRLRHDRGDGVARNHHGLKRWARSQLVLEHEHELELLESSQGEAFTKTPASHFDIFGPRLPPGCHRVTLLSAAPSRPKDQKPTSTSVVLERFPGGLVRARVVDGDMTSEPFDVFGGRASPSDEYEVVLRGGGREETRSFSFAFHPHHKHVPYVVQTEPFTARAQLRANEDSWTS